MKSNDRRTDSYNRGGSKMNKKENKTVDREHCSDCGSEKQLICISLPYIEKEKFRCKKCSSDLYKQINQK